MSGDSSDRNIEEFLGEAQELTDELNRILMEIHQSVKSGDEPSPSLVNAAFRATHTIKGLAGLFGLASMAHLSHDLEETLDSVRMGRTQLDAEYLDLLFEAVELFQEMMAAAGQSREPPTNRCESLVARLRRKTTGDEAPEVPTLEAIDLDQDVLSVLTEYEEHRLKHNLESGKRIYLVGASFDVTTIDSDLEALKEALQEEGEIITYLPSSEAAQENRIDLEILLASDGSCDEVRQAAGEPGFAVRVGEVPRRKGPEPVEEEPEAPEPIAEVMETTLRSVSQTVRVDIRRLDTLMNLLGETNVLFSRLDSLTRQIMEEQQPTHAHRQSLRTLRLLKRRLDELQTGILDVRMVPLEQLFDKLSRIVRKMSREAGKPVEFFVSGAETELDKLIVEELSDPLMHIIRNCIDHGIEPPEVRKEAGKRPEGLVALRAFQKGNHVIIEVEDDGAGISPETVLSTALQKKLIGREAAADLSEREILNLIFLPGFTTRAHADETSGRGVGMDVVKTNLAKLSGLVDIQSTLGMGTKFILTLPITLAILRALVVRCADQLYAVPLNSVLEALSVSAGQIRTVENREVITLRGATLPLLRLSALFGLGSAPRQDEHHFVIVVGMAQHRVGLVVDELQGQQDIVIKSLGKALASVPGIAGATELGTERIVLVLDLAALVDEALSRLSRTRTVA